MKYMNNQGTPSGNQTMVGSMGGAGQGGSTSGGQGGY